MSKQSELFTEELARRNPDWEKFVAVHKDLHRKLATAVEALKEIREVAMKTDWNLAGRIDATLESINKRT